MKISFKIYLGALFLLYLSGTLSVLIWGVGIDSYNTPFSIVADNHFRSVSGILLTQTLLTGLDYL